MREPEHWRVGVVDPHGWTTQVLRDGLAPLGAELRRAADWSETDALFRQEELDLLVLTMCLPADTDLDRLSRQIKGAGSTPLAVLSGCTGTDLAARVLFPNAIAFLPIPASPGVLRAQLLEAMRTFGIRQPPAPHGIVGRSPAMVKVLAVLSEVASTDSKVLLTGETGTGKELFAQTIHKLSDRAEAPFITIDCMGLTDGLLDSEIFGHARGSFTGAQRDRQGLFETARRGTVFLDEVADAPERVQMRLVRVLQEGEVRRVGESRTRPVDVRVIAASQRDLAEEVRLGRFREDLYYRLRVFEIHLPPLRERREDIPLLVAYWLERLAAGRPATPSALRALECHSWPGNVRELRAVLEAASIRASGDAAIGLGHLPEEIREPWIRELRSRIDTSGDDSANADLLREVLEEAGGVRKEAAALLGVSRTTLWRMMKQAGI